ncbi:amino acid transporter [Pseudovirgaria hyperparasitica]|uniref:Amino acid transporter n=1 Tax=Pseudovirgaria hyperparasitica TaxID=470096 RepID=A0A6A6WBU8_9PEZI|nr:amino acid transporter [Pseudovirgaria hyperparasitica]KAF2759514.1 amino acid transporter [Pseudovirgaria hyperparasitica]
MRSVQEKPTPTTREVDPARVDSGEGMLALPDVERVRADVTRRASVVDDAFGNEEGAQVRYKTCNWVQTALLMIAETISLGVLALPQAVAHLGLVPGLLLIAFLGIVATYTGFVIGQFKEAFPGVCSFPDVGFLIAGRFGREFMAVSSILILVFIMGAHIVSFNLMMNWLTNHATCTIVWAVIGTLVSFIIGMPRKMSGLSWTSAASCISILIAVLITLVALAVRAPSPGNVSAVVSTLPLHSSIVAVMTMILAYAGHVAFFSFLGEMSQPRDFKKALAFMTTTTCTFYMVIAAVIYYYAGSTVTSPALDGIGNPTITKVAYGIAAPTIVVAGVVNGAVAAKYIYTRYWAGTRVIHERSFKSLASWYFINAILWLVAFIIAEAIPNFHVLLSLIGSLFCSWFSYGLPGGLWLYMNKGRWTSSKRKIALAVVNAGILCLGATICVLGTWAGAKALANGEGGRSFSCGDNRSH